MSEMPNHWMHRAGGSVLIKLLFKQLIHRHVECEWNARGIQVVNKLKPAAPGTGEESVNLASGYAHPTSLHAT
jgi:hypothetical protein